VKKYKEDRSDLMGRIDFTIKHTISNYGNSEKPDDQSDEKIIYSPFLYTHRI